MQAALIGHTGYVGSTLMKQRSFDACYRSTNIAGIAGGEFDLVVCAGAPAQKWIANRDPQDDRDNLQCLMAALEFVRCGTFVLMSTVDVFQQPLGVTETTRVDTNGLHPYGTHRRALEEFVALRFPRHLIVRLAGLVGPGLRKNVIFDFLNDNNVNAIDSRGAFQFYPMVNLWSDIEAALAAKLELVHFTAEPVTVAEVAREGYGRTFDHQLPGTPAHYDMRTLHAQVFGGRGAYQYSRRESLLAIRAYAQSEPVTKNKSG
jgi:nucleoside-diphosphate-sugar epimerase